MKRNVIVLFPVLSSSLHTVISLVVVDAWLDELLDLIFSTLKRWGLSVSCVVGQMWNHRSFGLVIWHIIRMLPELLKLQIGIRDAVLSVSIRVGTGLLS